MAYVCDVDQIAAGERAAPRHAGIVETLAALPRRALDWLSAWNDAAEEAAISRQVFGDRGGRLTDSAEREMMQRVLHRNWSTID